jgi:hypothetical protein
MIALRGEKNLRFMFETTKGLAVKNAIPIMLKNGSYRT